MLIVVILTVFMLRYDHARAGAKVLPDPNFEYGVDVATGAALGPML
jgi:hypothetical protein